jgi:hypothetical protein
MTVGQIFSGNLFFETKFCKKLKCDEVCQFVLLEGVGR